MGIDPNRVILGWGVLLGPVSESVVNKISVGRTKRSWLLSSPITSLTTVVIALGKIGINLNNPCWACVCTFKPYTVCNFDLEEYYFDSRKDMHRDRIRTFKWKTLWEASWRLFMVPSVRDILMECLATK